MQLPFSVPPSSLLASDFVKSIPDELNESRDAAVKAAVLAGNVPDFLRNTVEVMITGNGHTLVLNVACDYLSVGTDDDWVRVPLMPGTAQSICDALQCILPTKKMVDLIWHAASLKFPPFPEPPVTGKMSSTEWFWQHQQDVNKQQGNSGLGSLVGGVKKDVVNTDKLIIGGDRVAIYGWHEPNGVPIQGLNPASHNKFYADYSHGIRLVARQCTLDGNPYTDLMTDVLADPSLCGLVSDEGVVSLPRYQAT